MTIKLVFREEHRPFTIAERFVGGSAKQKAIVVNSMKELLEAQHNKLPTSMFMTHPEENRWTRIRIRALFPKLQGDEKSLIHGVEFWKLYGSGRDEKPFDISLANSAITTYRELVSNGWQVLFPNLPDVDWSSSFLGMVKKITYTTLEAESLWAIAGSYAAYDENDQMLMTLTKQGVLDLIQSNPTHFTWRQYDPIQNIPYRNLCNASQLHTHLSPSCVWQQSPSGGNGFSRQLCRTVEC